MKAKPKAEKQSILVQAHHGTEGNRLTVRDHNKRV